MGHHEVRMQNYLRNGSVMARYEFIEERMKLRTNTIDNYRNKNTFILDCGGGDGWVSYLLKSDGYDVVSTDISYKNIKFMQGLFHKNGMDTMILKKDVRDPGFKPHSFDNIIALGLMEIMTVDERNTILDNYSEILKHGGRVFATGGNTYGSTALVKKLVRWAGHDPAGKYFMIPDEWRHLYAQHGFTYIDSMKIQFCLPLFFLLCDAIDMKYIKLPVGQTIGRLDDMLKSIIPEEMCNSNLYCFELKRNRTTEKGG